MMKLYDLSNSPCAARLRIQIRLKNLPVAMDEPPFALCSSEFLEAFPPGKLPLLLLDDDSTIAESTVIMDYSRGDVSRARSSAYCCDRLCS